MSITNLEAVKRELEAKRQEILEGMARARALGQVEGETGAPDIADRAAFALQREFSFSLTENEGKLLKLIDEALVRLANGKYGLCVHCGQPIEAARLAAVPWARHCLSCQELQDRGEL
ncbi:MAG: TraR/DksA C4-type zinc finger protein [Thermoanaerobaculum sp.]|nr:TraR/DksA C4-type zinc finger protein [Thermoanaerobaculum sp.]MCX7895154.1 TraR/DksA C4-type zinc finger protein [Thermoanaerobaculum sp.]MDW7966680.1 TraR/DksA C4-type zinc finger protein [Thermoanaerobaculum sp.]